MEKLRELMGRIKNNFSKNRILVSVLLLLWIVTIVVTLLTYKDSLGKMSTGNEAFDNVIELVEDVELKETVKSVEGSDALAIKMATFARRNNGYRFKFSNR